MIIIIHSNNNINAPTYPQIRLLYKEYFNKRTLTRIS